MALTSMSLPFLLLLLLPHAILASPDLGTATSNGDPEVNMTVPEIIRRWGYPVEVHTVTTEDGFILELHRIPRGRNENASSLPREPILLGHGLFCSSAVFVANLPSQSAGFVFADAGFDVWLANSRGTRYSKKHARLSVNENDFWDWSWEQMADYDLPALVSKVLAESGRPSLTYVGYSQGTLQMFAKLSADDVFAKKISRFFALAPVGTVSHIWGLARNYTEWAELALPFMFAIRPIEVDREVLSEIICVEATQECADQAIEFGGAATGNFNMSRLSVYLAHMPDSTSLRNLLHWSQMMAHDDVILRYDYGGSKANTEVYGMTSPPALNLSAIHTPLFLFWSPADALADESDVIGFLLNQLPSCAVKLNRRLDNYNHLDFAFGLHATEDVYQPIVRIIREELGGSV